MNLISLPLLIIKQIRLKPKMFLESLKIPKTLDFKIQKLSKLPQMDLHFFRNPNLDKTRKNRNNPLINNLEY
jgi:hypothetical protein